MAKKKALKRSTIGGRLMNDTDYLNAALFRERDGTLTIKSVGFENLKREGTSETERRGVIHFEETPKKLVCNRTNEDSIIRLLGTPTTEKWVGQKITLYCAQEKCFGETQDCIRVRPTNPNKETNSAQ